MGQTMLNLKGTGFDQSLILELKPITLRSKDNLPEKQKPEELFISRLLSAEYFLDTVLIIAVKHQYRLFVVHRKVLLFDKVYKTFKQASNAFYVHFKDEAYNKVRPVWSKLYPPDGKWLDKKLSSARGRCVKTGIDVPLALNWTFSYPLYIYVKKMNRWYDLIIIDINENTLICKEKFKTKYEALKYYKTNYISRLGLSNAIPKNFW